jgi:hypothetical protein
MKVLVATRETQGERRNDFCWVPEGELVTFPTFECDGDQSPDDRCGCHRSMTGVKSRKATTTFKVVEMAGMTPGRLARVIMQSQRAGGFKPDQARTTAEVGLMCWFAGIFDAGTVLERRGEQNVRARESEKVPA